jgi:hypothetical protein
MHMTLREIQGQKLVCIVSLQSVSTAKKHRSGDIKVGLYYKVVCGMRHLTSTFFLFKKWNHMYDVMKVEISPKSGKLWITLATKRQ